MKRKHSKSGLWFIFPSFVHLSIFVLFPIVFALFLSLHRWDVLKPDKPWVGLANYVVLFHDPLFWNAMGNSLYYVAFSVPLGMIVALGVALLVQQNTRGMQALRAIYYLPAVSSTVAISMVWTFIYLPDHGMIDWMLRSMGMHQWAHTDWLEDPFWAMPALIFMSIWTGLGPRMILYLAGLTGIPNALYEAAEIDGAGYWATFRHITLPLLLPTTFFILVTSSIGALQIFTPIYMMTKGGPMWKTDVVGYHIYTEAWRQFHMGMASAQSYVLFLVILVITVIQFKMVSKGLEEYSLQ